MKELKELITWFKEDPKDAIYSTVFIVLAFALFYCFIWLGAILEGNAYILTKAYILIWV